MLELINVLVASMSKQRDIMINVLFMSVDEIVNTLYYRQAFIRFISKDTEYCELPTTKVVGF